MAYLVVSFRALSNVLTRSTTRFPPPAQAHGGSVINKVPLRGYVIIDPESTGGKALLEDWVWGDGTDRHFVSPSFVENCIDAGKLLQFTDEAKRVQEQRVLATKEIGSINIAERPVYALSFIPKYLQLTSVTNRRPELPEETKVKLAAYLALMTPQNLSSCKVYQDLVYKVCICAPIFWLNRYMRPFHRRLCILG